MGRGINIGINETTEEKLRCLDTRTQLQLEELLGSFLEEVSKGNVANVKIVTETYLGNKSVYTCKDFGTGNGLYAGIDGEPVILRETDIMDDIWEEEGMFGGESRDCGNWGEEEHICLEENNSGQGGMEFIDYDREYIERLRRKYKNIRINTLLDEEELANLGEEDVEYIGMAEACGDIIYPQSEQERDFIRVLNKTRPYMNDGAARVYEGEKNGVHRVVICVGDKLGCDYELVFSGETRELAEEEGFVVPYLAAVKHYKGKGYSIEAYNYKRITDILSVATCRGSKEKEIHIDKAKETSELRTLRKIEKEKSFENFVEMEDTYYHTMQSEKHMIKTRLFVKQTDRYIKVVVYLRDIGGGIREYKFEK